jgi:hypothetical protein
MTPTAGIWTTSGNARYGSAGRTPGELVRRPQPGSQRRLTCSCASRWQVRSLLADIFSRDASPALALAVHVALDVVTGSVDTVVADDSVVWLLPGGLIEAFFIWRVWSRGRIAWWVGAVGHVAGILVLLVGSTDPTMLEYGARVPGAYLVLIAAVTALQLSIWMSPSVRGHVFAHRAAKGYSSVS